MVKIKDFTLALQNLGGGMWPPVPYTPGAHVPYIKSYSSAGLSLSLIMVLLKTDLGFW